MDFSLSLFKNLFDTNTSKRMDFEDFDKFENLLYDLSKIKRAHKKDAPLISPAVYTPETTRKNVNVIEWGGWAALDVDDHDFKGNLESELVSRFGAFYFVCYSTASSTIDKPKFRIVFPLTRRLEADSIKHFWFALNTEFGELGDTQVKDFSRMYYVPASYAGANNFIFSNHSGKSINPEELMSKHPFTVKQGNNFFDRLPEELQNQVIEYRKQSLKGKDNYRWTSYRDCPFINKNLIRDYSQIAHTDGSGRYAMIYKIMSSIAINAIKNEYPISSYEIAELISELDRDTSNKYQNRNLVLEADRAIEFAYRNA